MKSKKEISKSEKNEKSVELDTPVETEAAFSRRAFFKKTYSKAVAGLLFGAAAASTLGGCYEDYYDYYSNYYSDYSYGDYSDYSYYSDYSDYYVSYSNYYAFTS